MTKEQYAEEYCIEKDDDCLCNRTNPGTPVGEHIYAFCGCHLYDAILAGWDKSREVLLKESDEFDIYEAETQGNATQGGYLNEKGHTMTKEQYAEEYYNLNTGTRRIAHKDTFLAGWDKSREVLLKESDEFDEWAAPYALGYDHSNEPDVKHINNGARWQHSQDQIKIQALKEDALHWKTTRQIDLEAANQRIKELEEKLAKYEGKYLGQP